MTLALIYALTEATAEERELVTTVLKDGSYDRVSFTDVLDFIERRRGVQRARERAQHFTEKARRIISEFPESPYQRALCAVTELVTDRDH